MKKLNAIIVGLNLLFANQVLASSCDAKLLDILKHDQNLHIVRIVDTYTCGQEDSCAVVFEQDEKPFANSNILSYLDEKNNLNVTWAAVREGSPTRGWGPAGKYFCADVKTYLKADTSNEEVLRLEISKETARDMMFCPAVKTFISYKTQCTKNPKF